MELLVDSTNHAFNQLLGEEELIVQEYFHLFRNEHHDLCKLLSSGIATILRAHAAVRSLSVLSHSYMCPCNTAWRACKCKQPSATTILGICA